MAIPDRPATCPMTRHGVNMNVEFGLMHVSSVVGYHYIWSIHCYYYIGRIPKLRAPIYYPYIRL